MVCRTSVFVASVALVLTFALLLSDALHGEVQIAPSVAAAEIRNNFDSALFSLPPQVQRHYATRVYRVTGDSRYIPAMLADLRLERSLLQRDVEHLGDEGYIAERVTQLLNEFSDRTRKGRARKDALKKRGRLIFDLDLLYRCDQVREYGLEASEAGAWSRQALELLGQTDVAQQILDRELIKIYGAQLANAVYYLHACGVADVRAEFSAAFRRTFPDSLDDDLSMGEFEDKIYGMTHVVIAASDYYQQYLDPTEYQWILDYFEENADAILLDTRSDIIAEVGLCFILTGRENNEIVNRCRTKLLESYNREARMIPSESGSLDLEKGEHRNVLAYMLFTLPGDLYQGPLLEALDKPRY
jgi:hypothetical protein